MDYRYVIVGGGMTADAAAKAIRRADPTGSVVLISAEADAPYRRPPLSKALWNGEDPAKVFLGTEKHGVEMLLSDRSVALDVDSHEVTTAGGKQVRYERLLLATGVRPRTLPDIPVGGPIFTYRNLADFREARRRSGPGNRVLVVGGGFIGAELAAGLVRAGSEVHMVFREQAISAMRFPLELAQAVTADYRARGVKIHASNGVASVAVDDDSASVEFIDGAGGKFDLIIVGVGAIPNDELASEAGLKVDNGIVVDEQLRAKSVRGPNGEAMDPVAADVYAAGDVASFPWPRPLARGRIEHEDNAVTMGAHAGRQMAASFLGQGRAGASSEQQGAAYTHLPFFYSDLFDNGYEALGILDSRLETVVDWRQPGKEGVVYYLDDGLVVGILLWNTWGQVDEARELLLAARQVDKSDLRGVLPR